MKNFYGDWSYANNRFAGSYVMLGDKIVYVNSIGRRGIVAYTDLRDEVGSCKFEEISHKAIPKGYVNSSRNSRSCFVSRMPARQYRQGLRSSHMYNAEGVSFDMKDLEKAANKKYPSFGNCVDNIVNGERIGEAWCTNFSLGRNGKAHDFPHIHYKGKKVGELNTYKDDIKLGSKYLFLQEALEEAL